MEACVAVAATLAVVYPHMTGIGGDGFWLIHEPDGRLHAVHGCGAAAVGATLELYAGRRAIPWRGPLAAATRSPAPSRLRAAALASDSGTLPLERLLRNAIGHAVEGVAVTAGGAAIAAAKGAELRGQPGAYAAILESLTPGRWRKGTCCASPRSPPRCAGWRPTDWTVSTPARSGRHRRRPRRAGRPGLCRRPRPSSRHAAGAAARRYAPRHAP